MRHLHLQHHDRDQDRDHAVAERLQPALAHRSLPTVELWTRIVVELRRTVDDSASCTPSSASSNHEPFATRSTAPKCCGNAPRTKPSPTTATAAHRLRFDGGTEVPGSASPSRGAAADVRRRRRRPRGSLRRLARRLPHAVVPVDRRRAGLRRRPATATRRSASMTKNASRQAVDLDASRCGPRCALAARGEPEPDERCSDLHHRAHDDCFIANSVKSEVRCEPVQQPR